VARTSSPAPRTARGAQTRPARKLSISEAADYHNVSTQTIRRYIRTGRLPAYRVGARLLRIDPADLDRLSRRVPTVGAAMPRDTRSSPQAVTPGGRAYLKRSGVLPTVDKGRAVLPRGGQAPTRRRRANVAEPFSPRQPGPLTAGPG